MNTLYVNDLSSSLITSILDTINKRGYKVIYKRSNRKLKDACLRASKYVKVLNCIVITTCITLIHSVYFTIHFMA